MDALWVIRDFIGGSGKKCRVSIGIVYPPDVQSIQEELDNDYYSEIYKGTRKQVMGLVFIRDHAPDDLEKQREKIFLEMERLK